MAMLRCGLSLLALALGASLALGQAASGTSEFRDETLGVSFTVPAGWKLESRDRRTQETSYRLPLEGTTETAELRIFRVQFRAAADLWQTVQIRLNEQMKREVVRQWQQEILGAPMLMTKIRYRDKGVETVVTTGLLYSATPNKLMFRLTAPAADYDKAEFVLQQVWESMRTTTGTDLRSEDPNRRPDPAKPAEAATPNVRTVISSDRGASSGRRPGPSAVTSVEATLDGRAVLVRLPQGWSGTVEEDGSLSLRTAALGPVVRVELRGIGETTPPRTVLFRTASKSLEKFAKVNRREDLASQTNASGATIEGVWRTGDAASGSLFTFDGVVTGVPGMVIVRFESTSAASFEAERRQLRGLLDVIALELKP